MCVCHIYIKGYLLTYLLTYLFTHKFVQFAYTGYYLPVRPVMPIHFKLTEHSTEALLPYLI